MQKKFDTKNKTLYVKGCGNGYTKISNEITHNKNLCLLDIGLITKLLSNKKTFQVTKEGLKSMYQMGDTTFNNSWANLEKEGYIKTFKINNKGFFYVYVISNTKLPQNLTLEELFKKNTSENQIDENDSAALDNHDFESITVNSDLDNQTWIARAGYAGVDNQGWVARAVEEGTNTYRINTELNNTEYNNIELNKIETSNTKSYNKENIELIKLEVTNNGELIEIIPTVVDVDILKNYFPDPIEIDINIINIKLSLNPTDKTNIIDNVFRFEEHYNVLTSTNEFLDFDDKMEILLQLYNKYFNVLNPMRIKKEVFSEYKIYQTNIRKDVNPKDIFYSLVGLTQFLFSDEKSRENILI